MMSLTMGLLLAVPALAAGLETKCDCAQYNRLTCAEADAADAQWQATLRDVLRAAPRG